MWTAERYAIIYELDGGVNAAGNPAQYTVDQTITLEDPTKPGYTFKGWYADKDFTTLTVGIPVGSTEAKTFYAKWEQNPYKITWNVNEGDELTGEGYTVEAFYGNPITAPSDGGAVMLTDNAQQSGIGAGTFQNNHAGGYGGALYVGRVRVSLSLVTFDTGNTAGQKGNLIAIYTYLDNNKNQYVSYTDCWDKTQSSDESVKHSNNLYSSKGAYVTRDKL